jgi:hypothetical protein
MEIDEVFWGRLRGEVKAQYAQKIGRLFKAVEVLSQGDAWDRLRQEIKPYLRPPEQIRDCLERADAAHRIEHIGCSRERFLRAVRHAHEIRTRFTVLDLAYLVGVLPQAFEEVVQGLY